MMFEVKPIKSNDEIKAVSDLAAEIWRECYAELLSGSQIEYMLEKFLSTQTISRQIEKENYEYYFISENNEIVGFAAIAPGEDKRLFLSKIYLLKEHRGRGFTEEALSFIRKRAKETGCGKIWLTVNRYNGRAVAAYKKFGFEIIDTADSDIGSGYLMEDYIMETRL